MLTTKRFLHTNDDWKDCADSDKTWANWKAAYNNAHDKVRIKAQSNKGSVKFVRQIQPPD